MMRNNDVVVGTADVHEKPGARWHLQIEAPQPNLLLLNRSAHCISDGVLWKDLLRVSSYLKRFPQLSVIFRNTTIGHSNWDSARLHPH